MGGQERHGGALPVCCGCVLMPPRSLLAADALHKAGVRYTWPPTAPLPPGPGGEQPGLAAAVAPGASAEQKLL